MVVDSKLTVAEALAQDPSQPSCPQKVLDSLGLMEVQYYSFDGQLHVGQIVIARSLMTEVDAFFGLSRDIKFPIARVVPIAAPQYRWDAHKLVECDNVTYGFGYRPRQVDGELSLHAYGRAIDVNPQQNPFILYKDGTKTVWPNVEWDKSKPGALHADHPLVKLMEGYGWQWGGHWTPETGRTDYMHFQKT